MKFFEKSMSLTMRKIMKTLSLLMISIKMLTPKLIPMLSQMLTLIIRKIGNQAMTLKITQILALKMKRRWTRKKVGGDGGVATAFLDALDIGSLGSGGLMSSNISLTGSRCFNVGKGSNERVIVVVMLAATVV